MDALPRVYRYFFRDAVPRQELGLVRCEFRTDFQRLERVSVGVSCYRMSGCFKPRRPLRGHHAGSGFNAIVTHKLLDGGELPVAFDFQGDRRMPGEPQRVEDEGLKLVPVWLVRLNGSSRFVHNGNPLVGAMPGRLFELGTCFSLTETTLIICVGVKS